MVMMMLDMKMIMLVGMLVVLIKPLITMVRMMTISTTDDKEPPERKRCGLREHFPRRQRGRASEQQGRATPVRWF